MKIAYTAHATASNGGRGVGDARTDDGRLGVKFSTPKAMGGDDGSAVVRRLAISAERAGSVSRILVMDTGPGLPQKARENLFAAFRGSARSGGTGLGLAIAQELVRAHGGAIELVESIGGRTVFAIVIPDQPVSIEVARGALRRPA